MATTNPNVPAVQEKAAEASAPDAKVVPVQPVQQSADTKSDVVAKTAGPAATTAADPVPVDAVKRDAKEVKDVAADRAEEQKIGKELDEKNKGADYFQQVANNDAVTEDPWREAARLERQREADAVKGDPTRDPVAKQAAMDMNTPEPGAQAEAKKIRDGK